LTEFERFTGPVRAEFEEAGQRLDELLLSITKNSALPDLYSRYVQPPVRHLFQSRGKLLRPLLVLLSARAAGDLSPPASLSVIRAAAAVELIHTASLAHDDMVDGSTERRGVPSLHRAFGATAAVLVGDLFYSKFFQELAGLPAVNPALRMLLLDMFLEVTARMCEGEILEQQMRADGMGPSLEIYLHVTEAKTAGLISACCRAGALLNGAQDGTVEALAGYGQALGLLFQIADDMTDGDAALMDHSLLTTKAEECRRSAESLSFGLPSNGAGVILTELPGDILSASRR